MLAEANPGGPGDRKASGAVVASGVEVAGGGPYPLRPDGPPRAWGGLAVLMDAPCVDPPAALDDGPWCGPAMIPTAMAPAAITTVAAPATRACGWCRTRCHGPVPGGLMGLGKPLGPNGPARFATVSRCARRPDSSHANGTSKSVNECGEKVMSICSPPTSRLALRTVTVSGRANVLTASGLSPVTS